MVHSDNRSSISRQPIV